MLADQLAESVADLGRRVSVVIGRLGGSFLDSREERSWSAEEPSPRPSRCRSVGLAQGAVDGPGFRHPHLGTVDQRRHI